MVDINVFRSNPDVVRESQRKRYTDPEIVDNIVSTDAMYRTKLKEINTLGKSINDLSKQVGTYKKQNLVVPMDILTLINENKEELHRLEQETTTLLEQINKMLYTVGNIVHPDVPISNDENANLVLSVNDCGHIPTSLVLLPHYTLLEKIGGVNYKAGTNIAGNRGYFLKGPGVWLNQALINYGLQFLYSRGYENIQTPYFMNQEYMHKVSQLEEYDETLYKLDTGSYLIATSEQPMCAYHAGQYMNINQLPIKYASYSTCFRKEAGSHGRDTSGIFRIHQFEKVEQFCISAPSSSHLLHNEMQTITEEFYKSLGIRYRVVSIVSGKLNNAAAIKYDTEAMFPASGQYRELVSNSNCTDYQSRRLGIQYGTKQNNVKTFVHMLNSTLVATERTICCILENYQTLDGIQVPDVLMPYMAPYLNGSNIIPFIN